MRLFRLEGALAFLLAAVLSAPAWASGTNTREAVPGTINYVEGKVAIGTQSLDSKSIGTAELQAGQSLTTQAGKAEILLTPGVFLRVGDNSSVEMISPSLTDTEIGLNQGHAMIEVAELHPQNDIRIATAGKTTELLKTGLYDFDLNQQQLRVFDGKAEVNSAGRHVNVKGGHELSLAADARFKATGFDKKAYDNSDLFRWSSLRSDYLAEANIDAARTYIVDGWGPWGPGWWGAGWYWDPWFSAFTFIPGDGIFYSPFGWGFYSPWFVYAAPFYGFGHGVYHHFSVNYRNWGPGTHYAASRNYSRGVYTGVGSTRSGAYHSGGTMMAGGRAAGGFGTRGGFHGGGFHGGGMSHGR
jgi:FecR protein